LLTTQIHSLWCIVGTTLPTTLTGIQLTLTHTRSLTQSQIHSLASSLSLTTDWHSGCSTHTHWLLTRIWLTLRLTYAHWLHNYLTTAHYTCLWLTALHSLTDTHYCTLSVTHFLFLFQEHIIQFYDYKWYSLAQKSLKMLCSGS
jgi:hypothetical protein